MVSVGRSLSIVKASLCAGSESFSFHFQTEALTLFVGPVCLFKTSSTPTTELKLPVKFWVTTLQLEEEPPTLDMGNQALPDSLRWCSVNARLHHHLGNGTDGRTAHAQLLP